VVLGHGWDETTWTDPTPPTRQEVDRASYGGVVYLSRVEVHSCLASSALLALDHKLATARGFDDAGWLRQDAHHAVRTLAYESVSANQRRSAQQITRRHATSRGVGMVHEAGGPQINGLDDFRELLDLSAAEPGPEIVGYWGESGGPGAALKLGARGAAGDLFVDGAIGSRTAFMIDPYDDDDSTCGAQYLSELEMRDHLIACSRAGVQAGFHVIGDGAMAALLAAFRQAHERVGKDAIRTSRHRLEHVEMIDSDQIALLADLGVVASVQPVFDELWGGERGMYATRLGKVRGTALNPFAAMVEAGLALAFGSDSPVTPIDPWRAIRAASNHHTPSARITEEAGFDAHTRGGWRAAGRDHGGVLTPGAPASAAVWEAGDLQVHTSDDRVSGWPTDPRSGTAGLPDLSPDQPLPRCLRTIVAGKTVYTAA
jgi:predicted amidohydrolase YtcJ